MVQTAVGSKNKFLSTVSSIEEKRTKTSSLASSNINEMRFKLSHDLQTSLEISSILERFFENTQDLVKTNGLSYELQESSLNIVHGEKSTHKISYGLNIDDTKMGELTFYRRKKFAETELAVLEMLIGVLFYPLRNAVLYRQAIDSSLRDSLTGVGNRTAMELSIERELKLACRQEEPIALLLIDIDHFKNINDGYGHQTGDLALKHIAFTLQQTLRETDQTFRYGGEEFVVLLHNTEEEAARYIAERVRTNIASSPVILDNNKIPCTASIGTSVYTGTESAEQLIHQADCALYKAKESGRNKVVSWESLEDKPDKPAKTA